MKKILLLSLPIFLVIYSVMGIGNDVGSGYLNKRKLEVKTLSELLQIYQDKQNDTLYVINFWATWCKPCIEELPYFEEAAQIFSKEKVKVIYVSLNSMKETALVQRMIDLRNLQNQTVLLDESNPNKYIDRIDSSWSGSIPATVMYKNSKKVYFKEGSFTQEEIKTIITNKNK